jgi:hypothetical protein
VNREVPPYEAYEYGEGSGEAVALVTGFAGQVSNLDNAAKDIVSSGRDAVVYTYDPRIFLAGDAELLPQSIDELSADFLARTANHSRRRYGGVSLGGAIAVGMQKKDTDPQPGMFAATGIDAAELVMNNLLFRTVVLKAHGVDVHRAFTRNGYTLASLQERWQDIQIPPATPFTIALGGLDYIVRMRKIMRKMAQWQAGNHDIRVIRKPWLGHNGTMEWFNNNITEMLGSEPADSILAQEYFFNQKYGDRDDYAKS